MTTFELIITIVGIVISTGIFSGIFYVGRKIGKYDEKMDRYDERMERYDEKFDFILKKISELPCASHESKILQLQEDVTTIKTFLIDKNPSVAKLLGQKNSPTELSELGTILFNEVNGDDFLNRNEDFFFIKITNKNPKTLFDIETYAFEVLIENIRDDVFNSLKDVINDMPPIDIENDGKSEKYDVTIVGVCYVIGIQLRNRYIDKHPFPKQEKEEK